MRHAFREDGVRRALISLIDSLQQKQASASGIVSSSGLSGLQSLRPAPAPVKLPNPDLRLLVCFLCGDPFDMEKVLRPFLSERSCNQSSPTSIMFQTEVTDEGRKTIEFILTSYHGAQAFRDELLHGFVLVYSTQRRASLSTLCAFSRNIPNTPTQILAVTDGQPFVYSLTDEDTSAVLISDGQDFSEKIRAHFISSSSSDLRISFMDSFFKDALERKPQIEAAFDLEDSECSMEDRNPLAPKPPSRAESYDMTSTRQQSEDDYDEVLESGPASRDEDEGRTPSPFSDLVPGRSHQSQQQHRLESGIDVKYARSHVESEMGDSSERLVRPSQLKNRRSLHAGSYFVVAKSCGYLLYVLDPIASRFLSQSYCSLFCLLFSVLR